jgi:hypothetical protein
MAAVVELPEFDTEQATGALPEFEDAAPDLSKIKLDASQMLVGSNGVKRPSGMESGTDFTAALAGGALRAAAAVPPGIQALADIPSRIARGVSMGQGHYADMPAVGEERKAQSEGFGEAISKPIVPLDIFKAQTQEDDPAWAAAIKSAERMLVSIPEFVESPLGVLTMGAGLGGKAATTAVRYGFAADMLKGMFQQVPQLRDNWKDMTANQQAEAITQFLGTAAMVGLLTHPETRGAIKNPMANVADRTGQLAPDAIRLAPGGRPVFGAEVKPPISPEMMTAPGGAVATQLPPPGIRPPEGEPQRVAPAPATAPLPVSPVQPRFGMDLQMPRAARPPAPTAAEVPPKPAAPAGEAPPMVTEATVDKLPLADQGKLKHATGMEYGVTLTEADLPRLEEKYKASSEAMKKAFASGDSPAQLAAFGQMNFYGGALMGASRGKHPISGSNFERFAKERAAQGRPIPEPKPAAAPAPSAAPVAPAPAAPVPAPAAAPKAKAYSGLAYREPANEFKRLVLEYGEQQGWIEYPDFINPTAEGYAAISHNTEMTRAYKRALADIGITTDRNTLKLHAEALPKLKALLEAHARMEPVPLSQLPDGSEFTIAGEKYTVKGTNPDTGIVTIKDGRTLKVDENHTINIDPGSLKATPQSTDFLPPEVPKLRPGEKGTGELLQGPVAPFNLAGEKGVDPARVATEKATAEKTKAEAAAIAARQQRPLFGPAESDDAFLKRIAPKVDANEKLTPAEKSRYSKLAKKPQPAEGGVSAGIGGGIKRAQQQGRQGEAGFVTIPQGVSDAVTKAADFVSQIIREEFDAPKMTDRRRAVLNWSAKLQRSFGEAAAKQRDILKRVPQALRRDGITNWIQADGDPATLTQRRADTAAWRDPATGKPHPDAKRLLAGYDAALKLTPEEIAVANEVKADYARFAARGQGADVLNQLKDDYVTQTWNLRKGPAGTGSGRTLKEKFRFSRASTFANYFEGEQAGYSPKTKDISKLLPMYSHEMNAVIAARQMVAEMGQGVASDGRPLLAPKGIGIPVDSPTKGEATLVMPKVGGKEVSDYKVLANQPALSGWKWVSKDSVGNPVMLKADLALHPEAYKHLQAVLGRSAIRDWYGTHTTALAEIPKGIVHGIDWANSETKRTMLGMLATFHQVQTGTHAIGHRVNPLFSIPKVDLVGNAAQMDAARHGLMLLQDRASADQFMEGFRTSGLISRIPGIGPLSDWYSHYLFSQYIPGLKYKTYQAILERNLKVYDKQITSGRVSGADVKVLSAEQANAAYGHLNYADLGRNPTIQHIMQLGLLAPDFLEARGRFAGQAIKGTTGAKVGREQLLALATLAIAQGALAYTSAKISGGDWDEKRPFEFTLGNRRYTVRSVPEDMQNLLTNTRQFVHSRLSPIIGKGGLQYATGVDYRGRKISAGQTTKELAQQPIPLSIRGFAGIGQSTLSGMEQLASAIGLRISRYSPMMDMHDLIVDFKKSSSDPRVKADVEIQEQEVFASHYEKLRNALHSGDLAGARKEYDKLDGIRTPKQIDAAMKPWTGGNFNSQTFEVSPRHPKPFTGNPKTEREFLATLTPEQRQTYQKATAERAQQYRAFRNMLQQAPAPTAGALPEF